MESFEFYAPTRVIFGLEAEENVGEMLHECEVKKVLIHYGGKSAERSGLLERVRNILAKSGIQFAELGGVKPNPRLSTARKGIELCKKEGIDFILAIGGGSVIDSSKCIAYGVANPNCNVWDFYSKKAEPVSCTGVGVILTIAAAGSEMSESSVITNDEEGNLKRSCNSNMARPKFALMNPALTATLSPYQTASGCVDIVMHTLERYFRRPHAMELNDEIAEALIRVVIKNAKILRDSPENIDARAEVMWASSESHNGVTGNRFVGDWACHQLEHELGGMFDVAHGAGLAAIWGTWARYVVSEDVSRFARLARKVFGVEALDDEEAAETGIEKMEEFFESIGMPTSIESLGINPTDAQIDELAYKCSFGNTRTIGVVRKLDLRDMKNIYRLALRKR